MGLFKTKCPKCDSTNINTVKPKSTFMKRAIRSSQSVMAPILIFRRKPVKQLPLLVCKDCGFSWDKR